MQEFYGYSLDTKHLPRHIGIIMDGNGRWAKKRGLDRVFGHQKGYLSLQKVIEFNKLIGVKYITVYAFSTENWNRPKDEVNFLMELAKQVTIEYTKTLLQNNVRLMVTGTHEHLPQDLIALLDESIQKTSHCTGYVFNIAFNYGGRKEILDAVKTIAEAYKQGKIDLNSLDESKFSEYLYQPELPDVDLMIRTSGELRTSNFLLWQMSYSELWFTRKFWPDFQPKDYCKAISDYQKRKRRFGNV